MSFTADLRRFAQLAKDNADEVVRAATGQVANAVVARTPVGNPELWVSKAPKGYTGGRLRANWQFNEGSPLTDYLDTEDHASTLNKIMAGIVGSRAGGITFLSNNSPYGPRIEYEGWSGQAPAGMVRVTVAEFSQYVNEAVAKLKK